MDYTSESMLLKACFRTYEPVYVKPILHSFLTTSNQSHRSPLALRSLKITIALYMMPEMFHHPVQNQLVHQNIISFFVNNNNNNSNNNGDFILN